MTFFKYIYDTSSLCVVYTNLRQVTPTLSQLLSLQKLQYNIIWSGICGFVLTFAVSETNFYEPTLSQRSSLAFNTSNIGVNTKNFMQTNRKTQFLCTQKNLERNRKYEPNQFTSKQRNRRHLKILFN